MQNNEIMPDQCNGVVIQQIDGIYAEFPCALENNHDCDCMSLMDMHKCVAELTEDRDRWAASARKAGEDVVALKKVNAEQLQRLTNALGKLSESRSPVGWQPLIDDITRIHSSDDDTAKKHKNVISRMSQEVAQLYESQRITRPPNDSPIPMILHCPHCGHRHIDVGHFAEEPHKHHACQQCGNVWRPAIQCTIGVQFLPGLKDV